MLSHDVTRLEEVLPGATADVVNALAAYVWVDPDDADVEVEMQMTASSSRCSRRCWRAASSM